VDDEHVLAGVEAVHRTDRDAIHVFAFDAVFGDDVCHGTLLRRSGMAERGRPSGPRPTLRRRRAMGAIHPHQYATGCLQKQYLWYIF
jgi:hypothetical protein